MKVVGISQRRSRHAARFQCAVLSTWDAAGVAPLVGLDAEAVAAMQPLAAGVPADEAHLVAALVAALP